MIALSDLVRAEGFGFVVDENPHLRDGVLGDPPDPATFAALLCADAEGREYVACKADGLDHVYAASHEIAHSRRGHTHTEELAVEQANILARWLRRVGRKPVLTCAGNRIARVEFGPTWCDRCKDRPATISVRTLSWSETRSACTRCVGMIILELREAGFGRFAYDLVDAA